MALCRCLTANQKNYATMRIKPAKGDFQLSLGDRGEMIAAGYLAEQGYQVLDKKVRAPFGELDLVAQKDGRVIFVEVKTRSTPQFGLPEEAVDLAKQKQLTKLADWYLQKNKINKKPARFDVVALIYDGVNTPQIRHIENAFEAAA